MGRVDPIIVRGRLLAAAILGLTVGLAAPTTNATAQESETTLTCTNPVSGTSWRIMIDYRAPAVDSNPAAITKSGISWFDPKDGGNYTLDRQSGDLTASVASSTGGYFRRAHCTPEKSR